MPSKSIARAVAVASAPVGTLGLVANCPGANHELKNEYFALNYFSRRVYQYWGCSNGVGLGDCLFEGSRATTRKAI